MPPIFSRVRTEHIPASGNLGLQELGRYYPGIKVNGVFTGQYSHISERTEVHNYGAFPGFKKRSRLCMDSVHTGPPYLSGGDFSSLKYEWCTPYGGVYGSDVHYRTDKSQKFIGGFHAPSNYNFGGFVDGVDFDLMGKFGSLLNTNSSNFPSMAGLGDLGWKRTQPKLERASAFVFLAEARDTPRMLKQTSRRFHEIWKSMGGTSGSPLMTPKKLSDDFLNHQFGWTPFISDLLKFSAVANNYYPIMSKLIQQNDKWIRRRVTLGTETVVKILFDGEGNKCFPVALNANYMSPGKLPNYSLQQSKTTTTSAVAKFRYYRPEFDAGRADHMSGWNVMARKATIYGARLNPSNLYKAMPWSWAIDWFTNVGDHIDHLNSVWQDSVVTKYAFVMQGQTTQRTLLQNIPFAGGNLALPFVRKIDSKQRITAASPYGFNLSWSQLTPRQLAILAALGIGRT